MTTTTWDYSFAPIGPCIATWDEVPDPHQLQDDEYAVINIDRIGRLEFNVRDPLQRRWPKEIDEVSAQDVQEGTGGPGRRTRPLG